MKPSLQPGIEHRMTYTVPPGKVVAGLFSESETLQDMPRVFATGFLIGLLEWACVEAIKPHLDWPAEQSVGIQVDVTHEAPTPPGMEVLVKAEVLEVVGRRISFRVEANDGIDTISRGTHDRAVIDADSFGERAALKLNQAAAQK